ncbi:conserved hypothetical protein [Marivirga sericea]|uniref:Glycosyl transferase n=1 Tax=Marivirga sericea TaxID=1028 RepID=A0A1X7JII4_9BACT|nr:glycosyltransferase family protein [Marivirga sericea]SMG27547.1 conserved hypothetical protein [Marivirga sericea]
MKILYAIQGTGNGHISRARDIIPLLEQYGELDVLISGTQADVKLGHNVRYQFDGLSFVFGKRGGVDLWATFRSVSFIKLFKEILRLNVGEYDLVINDFEPVSAWACFLRVKKCIGLSHQAAVIHPFAPKPDKMDFLGHCILKYYAPVSSAYGFHFRGYGDRINLPIIRQEVRTMRERKEENHYTVYLPSYSDKRIIQVLSQVNADFQVFSKHCSKRKKEGNIEIIPIDNQPYLESLSACKGVICGAGFEGPSEALFLHKKLLVIPMKGQYEQQCNAAALKNLGVEVLKTLHQRHIQVIHEFIRQKEKPQLNFPDETDEIISKLMKDNVGSDYTLTETSFSFS